MNVNDTIFTRLRFLLLTAVLATFCLSAPGVVMAEENTTEPEVAAPVLEIPIPTIQLSTAKVQTEGDIKNIDIPWIAQYFTGIYKYAVGIGGFIAAVMLMLGGLQYLTSADSTRTSAAKKRITDSLTGLVIILGSYLLLTALNPDLTTFSSMKILQIERITMEVTDFSDESLESSDPVRDPEAPAPSGSSPSMPTPPAPTSGDMELINIRDAYRAERPVGMRGSSFYRTGTRRAWEMLKRAAATVSAKGCTVVVGAGWGRSGMDQLNGVINRGGQWSRRCKVYYGCRVSMGWRWCVLENSEEAACAVSNLNQRCWWTAPRTPDIPHNAALDRGRGACDVTSLLHTDAVDAWAIETSQASDSDTSNKRNICGTDNVRCARHRCQRELIRAWIQAGGCMLDNNSRPQATPIRWESWHLEPTPNNSCHTDIDARFQSNGFPFPS